MDDSEDNQDNQQEGIPQPWRTASSPLNLRGDKHELPKYIKDLSILLAYSSSISTKEHLEKFNTFYGIVGVDHEDFAIHLFVRTFTKGAFQWYNLLPRVCIQSWDTLFKSFLGRFKSRVNGTKLINELFLMKKHGNKIVVQFMDILNKLYMRIPQ